MNPALTCFLCFCLAVSATADVSYLVADLKYSEKHGLKICEVQHGSLSALQGDLHLTGGDGTISPKIADFFARFPVKKWAVGLIYEPLKKCLVARGWDVAHSINALSSSGTGIVYGDFDVVHHIGAYRTAYPGILFVNATTFPYWKDKYKMNALFDLNEELKPYKADWRLYPKKYDAQLSKKIQQDMPSELYVIKPRGEALANGVIVVKSTELDAVLKTILISSEHPYWRKNKDDSFLIEKYYESDYLREGALHYDATMRIVFILQSEKGKTTYHGMGGFWKLPAKALEEEGTLNEKRISACKPPFYRAVDRELLMKIDAQLGKAMLLLHQQMAANAKIPAIAISCST